ncbi:hypothetical protein [Helicobacter sp. T3_23-1059]
MLIYHTPLKNFVTFLFLGFLPTFLSAKYICTEDAKGFWCSTSKIGIGTYYANYQHPTINYGGGFLSLSSLYWRSRFSIGGDISGGLGEQKITNILAESKNVLGGFLGLQIYPGINLSDLLGESRQNPFILHFSTSFHLDNYGLRNSMPDTLLFTLGVGINGAKHINKLGLEYSLNYGYVVYGAYQFIERKNQDTLAITRRNSAILGRNSHETKASFSIIYDTFYTKFNFIYRHLDDSAQVGVKRFSTDSISHTLGYAHTHNFIASLEFGYSFGDFGK